MNNVFICSHIGENCLCGEPADYLCDAPRQWWEIPEIQALREQAGALVTSHKAASPREQQLIEREVDGINARIRHLFDEGPPEIRTCSAPVCDSCALLIGEDQHLCGAHAEQHLAAESRADVKLQALRARGPGVVPADGWIVWGDVTHRLRAPDDLKAICKRLVKPGWRPARDERRCKRCASVAHGLDVAIWGAS